MNDSPIKPIPVKDIIVNAGTQQRTVDDDVVARYAALIKDGVAFPAVDVISDGKNYYLFDGFHRLFAHKKLKENYIGCHITDGTKRDAIWLSFGANKANGFPRQAGTAKEILVKIFGDEEWAKTSQHDIAKHVGCTQAFVSKIFKELQGASDNQLSDRTQENSENLPKQEETDQKITVNRGKSSYEMKPKAEPKTVDSVGREVPKHIVDVFKRVGEFRDIIQSQTKLLRKIKEGKDKGDKLYALIKIERLEQDIANLKATFKFAMPYAVCIYCGADPLAKDCKACGGNGFINSQIYNAAPEDLKK